MTEIPKECNSTNPGIRSGWIDRAGFVNEDPASSGVEPRS